MKDYFSAIQLHLEDTCLLDAAPRQPLLVTYGVDNLLYTLDPNTQQTKRYELPGQGPHSAIALAPDGSHCLLASGGGILTYEFGSSQTETLVGQVLLGDITSMKYAGSGNFVAVGGADGKPVICEPRTGRKEQCRPGHRGAVYSLCISNDQQFVASIGQDLKALVYKLSSFQAPQEVAREPITEMANCNQLVGSFHPTKNVLFLPGRTSLQRLSLIEQRWQFLLIEQIKHSSEILLTEAPKENNLVTSSNQQVCIWNTLTLQKLFVVEHFHLRRTVSVGGTFFGMRDDGQLYRFKRELKADEPMEIEEPEQNSGQINFQRNDQEEQGEIAEPEKEKEHLEEAEYRHMKKTKADKIITCFPQEQLTSATAQFEHQRFLFVNTYGCVILRLDNEDTLIEVQFGHETARKVILARNRQIAYFDLNPFALAYATNREFGLRVKSDSEFEPWELAWSDIKGVALGCGWLAVANACEIRVFDMCGHQIRSMSFDREILALRAHQNLLAVVYHEGVPMWGSQQIAMQLYLVDHQVAPARLISTVHVPISPRTILRFLDFSLEGMIFSQDSLGIFRAFSLERSDWTTIAVSGLEDARRAWAIGASNQELIYWRTSQEDSEPTVAPRFAIKYSVFTIPCVNSFPEGTQQTYETLQWNRFSLDHEKARARLWGRLKLSRPVSSNYYYLVQTILTEKQIALKHLQLDQKYEDLVQIYLKAKEGLKALHMCLTCIRSVDGLKKMTEFFDIYNMRSLAIQLEECHEEKQKELEYEQLQIFSFMRLREAAEKSIKPRSEDPMRRAPVKRTAEPVPTLIQNSQDSLDSSFQFNGSQISSQSEGENPFLKRRDTQQSLEARRKEITEHVQKFGIKKKAQERNISRRQKS